MAKFQYERLPSSRHFRVLELCPGQGQQPIRCKLKTSHIDDREKYEAISYRWGSTELQYRIECNGAMLNVPLNCTTVLYYLRHKKNPRSLWIDAICVDQGTDEAAREEFKQQLKLTRDIYTNSTQVIAFLGPGTRNTKVVMQYLYWCGRFMRNTPFNRRNPRNLARPISAFQSLREYCFVE